GVYVIAMDLADDIRLRDVQFVVASVDKNALVVQHGPHRPVAKHRTATQPLHETQRHGSIVTAPCVAAAPVCYNLSSNPPPLTSLPMGVPLRKIGIFFVLVATAGWVSCGGGGRSSTPRRLQTFLAKRAFL